jgi:hypothetical protein
VIAEGKVESCRTRSNGFVVGVRTKPYMVEHFRCPDRFRIGESVEVHSRDSVTYTLVAVEPVEEDA